MLHKVAAKNFTPFTCPDAAALDVGEACAARVIGVGCFEGRLHGNTATDAKLIQPIELVRYDREGLSVEY